LIEAKDPIVEKVRSSHEETTLSRDKVRGALRDQGFEVVEVHRLRSVSNERYDMVVVVGGDGTVLDVARYVNTVPILAVNSSPSTSIGHFCCVKAEALCDVLEEIRSGKLRPRALTRIRVTMDGKVYRYPALNDVLLAHRVPAATSRYIVRAGDEQEEQKSSGVWISTAAGSTGAILSAGGEVMDAGDPRLQYRVREPFENLPDGRSFSMIEGMVGPEGISFTSRMIRGGLYLDGRRVAVPMDYGSRVEFNPTAPPLNIFLHFQSGRKGGCGQA